MLRGCGKPHIGAIMNFVGYYIVGMPIGALLCFVFKWNLAGIWCGLAFALMIVACVLSVAMLRIDWPLEARKAIERVGLKEEQKHQQDEEVVPPVQQVDEHVEPVEQDASK